MPPTYEDFSLIVEGVPGAYTVEAEASGAVRVPPLAFAYAATPALAAELELIRRGRAPSRERMTAIGGLLFGALFPLPIYGAFSRALGGLGADTFLRIKLLIRPPELADLPWELLYNPHDGVFLAARLSSPIVRVVESASPVGPIAGPRPLRLLYVAANPPDTGALDTAGSEAALREGLGAAASITALHAATPGDLRRLLQTEPGFDALHFDGHGTFGGSAGSGSATSASGRRDLGAVPEDERPAAASGALILHGPDGLRYHLGADQLAAYLDGAGIRLVVFAACETGADGTTERFAGVAQHLMRTTAVPAIVAMQYAVADDAAIAFCAGFYGALAAGYPVDAATVEGRKAILELRGGAAGAAFAAPDWATPVLFMRAGDGALFAPILSEEQPRMSDDKQTDTGGTTVNGSVNTGGGDFVGRDKVVHGDDVRGNKDARSGVFVSGGTVYGPVVGTNTGTITTSYGGQPNAARSPLEQALARVQAAIAAARGHGDDDQADDLKAVADALDAAIRAGQTDKAERRAAKLREAKDALARLADQYSEAAALRVSLATLW